MVMLKNRIMLRALIHAAPGLAYDIEKQTNQDVDTVLKEIQNMYRQLGIYDNIVDRIKLGGVI